MRAFGAYKEWHPNGQLKIDAFVIGGAADITPGAQQDWLFEETARVYNEKGNLIALISYEKGVMEGTALYYHPNGTLHKELPYHNNEIDGEAREYLHNGTLKSKTFYHAGLREGTSLGFWPESKENWTEQYHEGNLLEGRYYLPNSRLASEVKSGYGFRALFEENYLQELIEIRKGKPEGVVKRFTSDCELHSTHSIKQGKKQGEEIEYYLSSERETAGEPPLPKLSVPWMDDTISGVVKTWYNNGKLESQRELSRNKKTGTALAWYREGGLMYMEEYEEDRLLKGTYYKKNQKEPLSTVVNGNGVATLFDEQGIFLRKAHYLKGKPVDPET
jgi:antitoxin component YwqK of YwqJK toxin-antitoxin module